MRTKLIVGSLLALSALSASAALLDSVNIPKTPQQEAKIELGKMLWFDPRLSLSGKVSCNTCHDLSTNGADTKPLSIGYAGRKGTVNSPTVFNAEKQIAQFWDGRAKTLAEQATGPITNPLEMAMTPELAEGVIRSIPGYRPYFEKAFGSKNPTFSEIAEALAAFETTLTTPNAPFERYLKGDKNALTQQQIDGLKLFRRSGCIRCHSGNLLGGTSFQKVGSVRPYVTDNSSKGRMDVSGKPWDEMMFKVPTLLNVERTAPLIHITNGLNLKVPAVFSSVLITGRQKKHLRNKFQVLLTNRKDTAELLGGMHLSQPQIPRRSDNIQLPQLHISIIH